MEAAAVLAAGSIVPGSRALVINLGAEPSVTSKILRTGELELSGIRLRNGVADTTREQSAAGQEIVRMAHRILCNRLKAPVIWPIAIPIERLTCSVFLQNFRLSFRALPPERIESCSSQRGALRGAVFIAENALSQTLQCLPCLRPCAAS